MHPYLLPPRTLFEQHANPENAAPMRKYMREQFDFFGIKTPERRRIFREFVSQQGLPEISHLEGIVRELWSAPQREYQYLALDLLRKMQRQWEPGFITLAQYLIVTKSWWDTVDALASHFVGGLFARFPQIRNHHISRWRDDDNIWLRRTTLLFQLRYKENTDEQLLFALIRDNLTSGEFFIQKAIGWALREYSKTNKRAVLDFVGRTPLAPLSMREALKWLKSQGLHGG